MKPAERYAWIEAWIKRTSPHDLRWYASVDVVDRAFSDAYIDECGIKNVKWTMIGANVVPQLGRDLSAMYEAGRLVRWTTGVHGVAGMGFPRWVYAYSLPNPQKKTP